MHALAIFSPPKNLSDPERLKRRHMLARTGLAWLAMMQVMMFAFPGYLRTTNMAPENLASLDQAIYLMNWVSLALTAPVIVYCAWPLWKGAVSSLTQARVGMDVPVALGIIAAFIPSAYATWTGRGEVYFDSVSMFVAFLLTARYMELCARQSVGQGRAHQHIEEFRVAISGRANTLAFWFVVVQIVLALLVGAIWFVYRPEHAVAVMVALLVMSCPCAMSMATPTAIAAAHASLTVRANASDRDVALLAQATGRVARQNLYGSITWHLLMTPLAAIGLVAPWVAAITMLLSSLAVAANSWRLFRRSARDHAVAWRAAAA
jgi:cation transport ATPase